MKRKTSDKRRDKKSKHRKRRHATDDDPSSSSDFSSTTSDDSSERYWDRKKRHKKEHRKAKKQKKEKKVKRDRKQRHSNEKCSEGGDSSVALSRNYALADELLNLFERHPSFATDLPIMLARLGSGATFDLSSMTDQDAASGLMKVMKCLFPFGVISNENGNVWSWKNPAGSLAASNINNELVLIRVVRALLDQIGITIEAVEQYENPLLTNASNSSAEERSSLAMISKDSLLVDQKVESLLRMFGEVELAADLAGLCQMILDGECVNLDDLPNDQLKEGLGSLFDSCGLEKLEIDVDNMDGNADVPLGYGLPDAQAECAKGYLSRVLDICQEKSSRVERRSIQGPLLKPTAYNENAVHPASSGHSDTSDEDDGPLPLGFAAKAMEATLSKEHIKASASRRALEMECAKQGIKVDSLSSGNIREEWMVVPGKFDFFDSIKSGQPIRSRTFEGKSKVESRHLKEPIDPKVQAEIRAFREAYEDSRGPSLMDQHREARKERLVQDQSVGKDSSWKWDRDKDLDAGRRVDKEALGMILGGAGSDLKSKFQSAL